MIQTKLKKRRRKGMTDKCKEKKTMVTRWTRFCVFRWCSDVTLRRVFDFDLKLSSIAYYFRVYARRKLKNKTHDLLKLRKTNFATHIHGKKNETNFFFDFF